MPKIKFNMSSGESITSDFEMAEKILNSEGQLVMMMVDGQWTGKTINKAHIVSTVVDDEPEVLEILKTRLGKDGFQVTTAIETPEAYLVTTVKPGG